jgi:hypothetical protein
MSRAEQIKISVNEQRSKEIRESAKAGLSLQQLCEKFNVGKSTIRRHVISTFQQQRVPEFVQREIRSLHKQGVPYWRLEERYGLNKHTLIDICRRRYR